MFEISAEQSRIATSLLALLLYFAFLFDGYGTVDFKQILILKYNLSDLIL